MPLNGNGVYTAPTFVNDGPPALNATEMNALAGAAAGAVEYDRPQTLSDAQKAQAIANMGALGTGAQELTVTQQQQATGNIGAVSTNAQTLSEAQRQRVRTNIGALGANDAAEDAAKLNGQFPAYYLSVGVSATATAAGWSESAPYTQTVGITGMTADANAVVGLSSSATAAMREATRKALILCTAQANGSITLTADGEKPTIDISLAVIIWRAAT